MAAPIDPKKAEKCTVCGAVAVLEARVNAIGGRYPVGKICMECGKFTNWIAPGSA